MNTDICDYYLGDLALYVGNTLLIRGPIERTPAVGEQITVEGKGPGKALMRDTTRGQSP